MSKPWLRRTPTNAYSRLMSRLLLGPDVAVPVPAHELPLRLRSGSAAVLARCASTAVAVSRMQARRRSAGSASGPGFASGGPDGRLPGERHLAFGRPALGARRAAPGHAPHSPLRLGAQPRQSGDDERRRAGVEGRLERPGRT